MLVTDDMIKWFVLLFRCFSLQDLGVVLEQEQLLSLVEPFGHKEF